MKTSPMTPRTRVMAWLDEVEIPWPVASVYGALLILAALTVWGVWRWL